MNSKKREFLRTGVLLLIMSFLILLIIFLLQYLVGGFGTGTGVSVADSSSSRSSTSQVTLPPPIDNNGNLDLSINLAAPLNQDTLLIKALGETSFYRLGNDFSRIALVSGIDPDVIIPMQNSAYLIFAGENLYINQDRLLSLQTGGRVNSAILNPSNSEIYIVSSGTQQKLSLIRPNGAVFGLYTFAVGLPKIELMGADSGGSVFEFMAGNKCYKLNISTAESETISCNGAGVAYTSAYDISSGISTLTWNNDNYQFSNQRVVKAVEVINGLVIWSQENTFQTQQLDFIEAATDDVFTVGLPFVANIIDLHVAEDEAYLVLDTGNLKKLFKLTMEKVVTNSPGSYPESYVEEYIYEAELLDMTPDNCITQTCEYEFR